MVRRSSSISAWPALGPDAKKVAGSPGNTRISVKVTITTPSSAGIDARSRRPTRRAIPASKSLHPLQITEVGLPVELIGVSIHRLGHHGVVVRLPEHDQGRLGGEDLDHLLAIVVVFRLVGLVARVEGQLLHLGALEGGEVPALLAGE